MALAPYPNSNEKWWGSLGSADSIIIPNCERFFNRLKAWCVWDVARSMGIGARTGETPRSDSIIILEKPSTDLLNEDIKFIKNNFN